MIVYSVLMFIISLVFVILGLIFIRGKYLPLMRPYQRKSIKNVAAYGKAMGQSWFIIAIFCFISGVAGLLGESAMNIVFAVALFVIGIIAGLCYIIKIEGKRSGGLF